MNKGIAEFCDTDNDKHLYRRS